MTFDYNLIKDDYQINENDDDTLYAIKEALTRLTTVEKKIFLTYCELGTYSATARQFNVTSPTIKSYINQIKNKILKEL